MSNGSKVNENAIVLLKRADIFCDYDWNIRHRVAVQSDGGPDESVVRGAQGVKESIASVGQDDPIDVIPNPFQGVKGHEGSKQPYFLMNGFTRCAMLDQLDEEGMPVLNVPKGQVLARVHNLTLHQAEKRNARDNIVHDSVSTPDKARALGRYVGDEKDPGKQAISSHDAAKHFGMAQGYVSELIAIGRGLDAKVMDQWRTEPGVVSYEKVKKIATLDKAEQLKAYTEAKKEKLDAEKQRKAKSENLGAWVEGAKKHAAELGATIGVLCREGFLQPKEDAVEWEEAIHHMGVRLYSLKVKETGKGKEKVPATRKQVDAVAKAAREAYAKALETPKQGTEEEQAAVDGVTAAAPAN